MWELPSNELIPRREECSILLMYVANILDMNPRKGSQEKNTSDTLGFSGIIFYCPSEMHDLTQTDLTLKIIYKLHNTIYKSPNY